METSRSSPLPSLFYFCQFECFFCFPHLDAASADQQKPTAMKQEDDDEGDADEDDIAMDTDEEKDLQAVEAPELKPEKLDSSKASKRGTHSKHLSIHSSLYILTRMWSLSQHSQTERQRNTRSPVHHRADTCTLAPRGHLASAIHHT